MRKQNVLALGIAFVLAAAVSGCGSAKKETKAAVTTKAVETTKQDASEKTETEAAGDTIVINEDWPEGTVYVSVGSKAGGGADTVTRIYTQFFEKYTGQAFTVVNDTTGNGALVYENTIAADPSGLDLMMASNNNYVSYFNGQVSTPLNDETAVTLLGVLACPLDESSQILIVRKDAPYSTLEEYVAYAKENPGQIKFGLQNGGGSQYGAILMDKSLQIEEKYVESGSVADKLVSLVGGNIDACTVYPKQAKQYIEAGDVKAIAVLGEKRSSITPDVPSFVELGYESAELGQYHALWGPAGMDEGTVNAIHQMIRAAYEDPEVIDQIEKQGMGVPSFTLEEGRELFNNEFGRYEEISKLVK